MSKRPPIRRVSIRHAPPTAVTVEHRTDDDDDLPGDSELELPTVRATQEISTDAALSRSDTPVASAAQSQPTAEDAEPIDTKEFESDSDHPTTLPDTIQPSLTTAVASLVASSSSTALPRGRRLKKSKEELYKEYMFGIDEQAEIDAIPRMTESPKIKGRFRLNRTYNARMDCNVRRITLSRMVAMEEGESSSVPDLQAAKRNLGSLPSSLFHEPKIKVRQNLGSKFRYLYNRRPQGVKVYFKHAKANPKDRPPFVSATRI